MGKIDLQTRQSTGKFANQSLETVIFTGHDVSSWISSRYLHHNIAEDRQGEAVLVYPDIRILDLRCWFQSWLLRSNNKPTVWANLFLWEAGFMSIYCYQKKTLYILVPSSSTMYVHVERFKLLKIRQPSLPQTSVVSFTLILGKSASLKGRMKLTSIAIWHCTGLCSFDLSTALETLLRVL